MTASIWGPGDIEDINQVNGDNTFLTERFVAIKGQKDFTITNFQYALNSNSLEININGIKQAVTYDFTETSPSTFSMVEELEDGDVVDIRGLVGASGTQSAAQSAANAQASAAAADASYQSIVQLSLPSLPLTLANGGLGTTYTKGSWVVKNGAANALFNAGANNEILVADSTTATGLKWEAAPLGVKQLAATDTLDLSRKVNYNYTTATGSAITYNVTGVALNTVMRITALSGNATLTASNGTVFNTINGNEYQLVGNSVPQGFWAGSGYSYGRIKYVAPAGQYIGSAVMDSSTTVLAFISGGDATSNTLTLVVYNPTTKTIAASYNVGGCLFTPGAMQESNSSAASGMGGFARIFKTGNNSGIIFICPQVNGRLQYVSFSFVSGTSLSLGTITDVFGMAPNWNSPGQYIIGHMVWPVGNNHFLCHVSSNPSSGHYWRIVKSVNNSTQIANEAYFTVANGGPNNVYRAIQDMQPAPTVSATAFLAVFNESRMFAQTYTYDAATLNLTAGALSTANSFGSTPAGSANQQKATLLPIPGSTSKYICWTTDSNGGGTEGNCITLAANGTMTFTSTTLNYGRHPTTWTSLDFRTDAFQVYYPRYIISGNNIWLIDSQGIRLTQESNGSLSNNVTFTTAGQFLVVKSLTTGKVYLSNSTDQTTKLFNLTNGTLGTTLGTRYASTFVNENVWNGCYWNVVNDAGTILHTGYTIIPSGHTYNLPMAGDGKTILTRASTGYHIIEDTWG